MSRLHVPQGFGCKTERSRQTLAAVALQDHITRSLSIRNNPHHFLISNTSCPAACVRGHKKHNGQPRVRYPERTQGRDEREYVLDPAPPPLTLAQRMGLVAGPSARLTAKEWAEVKSRSIQEGDSTQPCAICKEEFRLQPQVLLSCSHVFHKVCLKSFEKFSGRKSCPMCRTEQYETRVIFDGARLYREKCALRIQKFWRGYRVRKWYSNIREHVPPKDKRLRQKFFEKKLQELTERLVQACSTDVEAFLNDMDRSSAVSHDVLCVCGPDEKDWLEAQEKAFQRGVQDCPICLNRLISHNGSFKDGRDVLLLSCSHLFHKPCLQAFELFCQEVKPTCPLCRSHYAKMLVVN